MTVKYRSRIPAERWPDSLVDYPLGPCPASNMQAKRPLLLSRALVLIAGINLTTILQAQVCRPYRRTATWNGSYTSKTNTTMRIIVPHQPFRTLSIFGIAAMKYEPFPEGCRNKAE